MSTDDSGTPDICKIPKPNFAPPAQHTVILCFLFQWIQCLLFLIQTKHVFCLKLHSNVSQQDKWAFKELYDNCSWATSHIWTRSFQRWLDKCCCCCLSLSAHPRFMSPPLGLGELLLWQYHYFSSRSVLQLTLCLPKYLYWHQVGDNPGKGTSNSDQGKMLPLATADTNCCWLEFVELPPWTSVCCTRHAQ